MDPLRPHPAVLVRLGSLLMSQGKIHDPMLAEWLREMQRHGMCLPQEEPRAAPFTKDEVLDAFTGLSCKVGQQEE